MDVVKPRLHDLLLKVCPSVAVPIEDMITEQKSAICINLHVEVGTLKKMENN